MVYSPRIGPDGAFVREIKDIKQRISSFETRPAGQIVIRETLTTEDPVTGVKTVVGQLPDGSYGVQPFIGDVTPPPVATTPIATAQPGIITVTWDGLFVNNEEKPRDFEHVNVIGHKLVNGSIVSSLVVGVLRLSSDTVLITQDIAAIGDTWQFSLESEDYNGNKAARGEKTATITMLSAATDEGVNAALDQINQDVISTQSAAASAQNAADTAQKAADDAKKAVVDLGSITGTIYTQSATPSANSNSLWIDTAHNNVPRRYLGKVTRTALVANVGGGASIGTRLSSLGYAVSAISVMPTFAQASAYDVVAFDAGYAGLSSAYNTLAVQLLDRGVSIFTSGNDTTSLPYLFTGGASRGTPKNPIRPTGTHPAAQGWAQYSDVDLNFYLTGVDPNATVTGVTLVGSVDQPLNIVREHPTTFARWAHVETYATPADALNAHLNWVFDNWVVVQDQGIISAASAAASAQSKADQAFNNAATAATAAGNAQTTADGKNRVWYQTSAPAGTGNKVGDTWFDTDDGYKIYVWDGSAWKNSQDAGIAAAQNTANTKTKTYFQTSSPALTGNTVGDIWFDTDDANRTYVWNGTTWADARDTTIAAAQSTANTALTSANGKNRVYYQGTMPAGGTYISGDTWFDTSNGNKIYVHNGTTFVAAQDAAIGTAQTTANNALTTANSKTKTYFQSAQPAVTGNTVGDTWFDTGNGNKPYVWNGSAWTLARDAAITAAQTSADGKNKVWYQTSQPAATGNTVGDTWFDTDDGNKIYVWSGSAWTNAQDATIAAAQNTANSKTKTYFQTTQPAVTGNIVGDTWFDTGNGNKPYVWNGSSWANAQDAAIGTAQSTANSALTSANGKNRIYYQGTQPSGGSYISGDTWFDTSNGNKIYVYNGSTWTVSQDTAIAAAQSTANTANSTANSALTTANSKTKTYFQSTSPAVTGNTTGDIWFDTGNGNKTYVWNGSTWASAQDTAIAAAQSSANGKNRIYYQTSQPTGGTYIAGDTWFDTSNGNKIYVYSGSAWVSAQDASIATAQSAANTAQTAANTAQTTANAKTTTFTQSTAPSATGRTTGDIWFDTSNGNKPMVWNGSAWTSAQDAAIATAQSTANSAQTSANGKNTVFYQTTAPAVTGRVTGDTWFDTANGYRISVWNGSAWTLSQDTTIATAQSTANSANTAAGNAQTTANNALSTANSKTKTYFQSAQPAVTGNTTGDTWFDTGNGNKTYVWNGSAWTLAQDAAITAAQTSANGKNTIYYQSTSPAVTGRVTGDTWFDTGNGYKIYVWNGSAWTASQDTAIAAAQSTANTANTTANSKTKTFIQGTTPTASTVGDIWIDTANGNVIKTWEGSSWVTRADAAIAAAQSAANAAQTSANGKNTNVSAATAPATAGHIVGDLWFDTSNGNKPMYFNGSAWVSAQDAAIATAQSAANAAQTTANSKTKTFTQGTAPTASTVGDIWIDTANGNVIKVWDGSAWITRADAAIAAAQSAANTAQTTANGKNTVISAASAPATAGRIAGDIWFDTSNGNKPMVFSGTAWVSAQDASISTAQNTANSKTKTFIQGTAPTATTVGDIWIDTANGNVIKTWEGSAWVTRADAAIAAAQSAATAAQTSANGKNTNISAATAPATAGHIVGDLWFDTSNGNKPMYFNGSAWVSAQDASIATAQSAANTAQTTANGKNTATYSSSAASGSGSRVGDIWFQTNASNIIIGQWQWNGSAWIQQTIDNAVIANLDAGKINAGYINAARIQANTITSTMIATDTITAGNIASGAITASELAAGSVQAQHLTANSVSATAIVANTITAGQIAGGTITASQIATDTITAGNIASGAITASELAVGSVQAQHLTANSVSASAMVANTITAGQIAGGTITAAQIATDTITAGNIAAGAITASELSAGSVQAQHLTANAISATAIAADSITSRELAAGSITAAKGQISDLAVTTAKIADTAITNAKIANLAVGTAQIQDTAITNAKIANLDAGKITTGTLDANRIGADTITATHIASDAVTANELAANSITAAKGQISDLAVTNAKIADLAVTNAKIADATIASAKIAQLDAGKITTGTLDANRIGAYTVTANKIAVGDFTNLFTSPQFASTTGGVTINGGATLYSGSEVPPIGLAANIGTRDHISVDKIATRPGDQFYLEFTAKRIAGTAALQAGIWITTASGAASTGWSQWSGLNGNLTQIADLGNGWARYSAKPYVNATWAGVSYAQLYFQINQTSPYGTNWLIADIEWRRRATGNLLVDGAITAGSAIIGTGAIGSAQIADLSVGTAEIADTAITTAKIANLAVDTAQIKDTAITNAKIGNLAVGTAQIQDTAITNAKIANLDAGKITTGTLDANRIGADTITATHIASDAITANELAANSITAAKGQIADLAITTAKIQDTAITNAKIANLAVGTAQIQDTAITNAKIANLDAGKITTGTLDANRIGANSISAGKLMVGDFENLATINEANNITVSSYGQTQVSAGYNTLVNDTGQFFMFRDQTGPVPFKNGDRLYYKFTAKATAATTANFSVYIYNAASSNKNTAVTVNIGTTDTIVSGSILVPSTDATFGPAVQYVLGLSNTTSKGIAVKEIVVRRMNGGELLVDGSITAGSAIIANGAIGTAQIGNLAVGTAQIADTAITTAKIANLAVDTAQIKDTAITNAKIANLDAGKITTGTLDANRIGADTITAAHIASDAITANELAANSITAAKGQIADLAITTAKIQDTAITNAKIANLDAAKITTGTLDANRIGANTITATKLNVTMGGTNLVSNSSFEADSNSDGLADGWNTWARGAGDAGRVFTNTRPAGLFPGSTYAQRVTSTTVTNTESSSIQASTLFSIAPGALATISLYGRASIAGNYQISIRCEDDTAAYKGDAQYIAAFTTTTQRFSGTVVIPAGTTRGKITVTTPTSLSNGHWFEVDGIQAELGDVASSWGPMPTELLPGTITGNMIQANAIQAGSAIIGTGAIGSAQIADLSVGTAEIADLAVKTAKIDDLAITNAKIANATIQAAKIGSVDAGTITAGTLSAGRIGAKTITTDKLVVSSTNNLVVEADFSNGGASWGTLNANKLITASSGRNGLPSLRVTGTTATQTISNLVNRVTVGTEDRFRGSFYMNSSAAAPSGAVKLYMKAYSTATSSTPVLVATSQAVSANSWTLVEGYSNAFPSGVTSVEFYLEVTNAATATTLDIDYVSVTRAADARLVVDGAIDGKTITGAIIQTASPSLSGARLVMDSTGLRGWDGSNKQYLSASANGLAVTGSLGATGDGVDYSVYNNGVFGSRPVSVGIGGAAGYVGLGIGGSQWPYPSPLTAGQAIPGIAYRPTTVPMYDLASITARDGVILSMQSGVTQADFNAWANETDSGGYLKNAGKQYVTTGFTLNKDGINFSKYVDAPEFRIGGQSMNTGLAEVFDFSSYVNNSQIPVKRLMGSEMTINTALSTDTSLAAFDANGLYINNAGVYDVHFSFGLVGGPGGARNFAEIGIIPDDRLLSRAFFGAAEDSVNAIATGVKLNAGDVLKFEMFQNSGGSRNVTGRIRLSLVAAPGPTRGWATGDITQTGNFNLQGDMLSKPRYAQFYNNGFTVANNYTPWDTGPVTEDTGKSRNNNFAAVGPYAGSVKFTQSGWYQVSCFMIPTSGDPLDTWMRIFLGSTGENLGQAGNRPQSEIYLSTVPIYIAANDYIRSTVVSRGGFTTNSVWKITKFPWSLT